MVTPSFLPVTVDKRHLVTIGERLYAESIELLRELVNNAYDADATEVRVTVRDDLVRVDDNGHGMDLVGLKQYFNIGSPEKILKPKSPRFHRDRIGQFGIGKFATLSACECFEVVTQKGDFAARVTFDKVEWERPGEEWRRPLELLSADPSRGDGTTVTLLRLTRAFDPREVQRRLIEGVPLKAPHFSVLLNGERVATLVNLPIVYQQRLLGRVELDESLETINARIADQCPGYRNVLISRVRIMRTTFLARRFRQKR